MEKPMPHPKKSETVYVEILGDELGIYDWQRKKVHALNPTAALVWQHCDGQTSPAELAVRLEAELNVSQAEALVWLTLDQLEKAHLLEDKVARPSDILTRREILRRLGVTAALLPMVTSITAPYPIQAQSPVSCIPPELMTLPTPPAAELSLVDACFSVSLGGNLAFAIVAGSCEECLLFCSTEEETLLGVYVGEIPDNSFGVNCFCCYDAEDVENMAAEEGKIFIAE
jgi:hypothetical protein